MLHTHPTQSATLGADLRAIRKVRGLTLSALAHKLGRSIGWLSQVERDLSQPSITDLRQIAAALGSPVSLLFGQAAAPAHEAGIIVRRGARRPIGSTADGLVEELLSPDLTDDFEMVHSTFLPHSRLSHPIQRPTQEVGYIVQGQLDLTIDDVRHSLNPGDSFRIRGAAFLWANPHPDPAIVIWVIAPPVY